MIKITDIRELTNLEQIVPLPKPHIEFTLLMADALNKMGDYEKALEIYDRVLKMDPHDTHALQAKGTIRDLLQG